MSDEDALKLVPEKWREDFKRFLQTGNASPEFLDYLDNDQHGQQAVEIALKAESSAFETLAETVRPAILGTTPTHAREVSEQITHALEDALSRPPNERKHSFRGLRDTVKLLDEPARRRILEVVRDLDESLVKS
ncbi:MAG TPA: hypothetical protein VF713_12080 [Thermoanaerobaculia bacterium]